MQIEMFMRTLCFGTIWLAVFEHQQINIIININKHIQHKIKKIKSLLSIWRHLNMHRSFDSFIHGAGYTIVIIGAIRSAFSRFMLLLLMKFHLILFFSALYCVLQFFFSLSNSHSKRVSATASCVCVCVHMNLKNKPKNR